MAALELETQGRRVYIRGNTYPIKDQIRAAGAKWDADARAWYVGVQRREVAERICASVTPPERPAESGTARSEAPGTDATVAGRGKYKGRTYYLAGRVDRGRTKWDDEVLPVSSRDGSRLLLYFRDGSRQFWARTAEVEITRGYRRPTTIERLRDYAEQRRREERGEAGCPVCERHCTCGTGRFCRHHHDGCDRCGAEG